MADNEPVVPTPNPNAAVAPSGPALSATTDRPTIVPDPVAPPTPEPTVAPPAPPTGPADLTHEPRSPIAPRIAELVGERRRLEQLVNQQSEDFRRLMQRHEELLTRQTAPVPIAPTPAVPVTDFMEPRPSRDSFADPVAYDEALVDWGARRAAATTAAEMRRIQEESENLRRQTEQQTLDRRAQEEYEARTRAEAQTLRQNWEVKQATVLEKYPDYYEVTNNPSLPISVAMVNTIVRHENGPDIAYFLGKNPAEASRIAGLVVKDQVFPQGHPMAGLPVPDAAAQAFELGLIAAKLAPPSVPTVTNALAPPVAPNGSDNTPPTPTTPPVNNNPPPPPNPIVGAAAAATQRSPSEESMEEYGARRSRELLAERRPGRQLH